MFSADADLRLSRRIKRDTADNARNIEAVLDQVATSSPPSHFLCYYFQVPWLGSVSLFSFYGVGIDDDGDQTYIYSSHHAYSSCWCLTYLMQYSKFVKPAFDDFILPTKKYADIIIPRGGDNHVAIDLIVQHIRTKLGQHDLCKIYPNLYVIQSTFQVPLSYCLLTFSNPILSFPVQRDILKFPPKLNHHGNSCFADKGHAHPDTRFSDKEAWLCILCWPFDSFGMYIGCNGSFVTFSFWGGMGMGFSLSQQFPHFARL